jgi:hypothetical protein
METVLLISILIAVPIIWFADLFCKAVRDFNEWCNRI